ncbi:hydrogen peroxide-inducible genes activator [Zavarzinia sp. CC-PAN008]|uniref:hydrogen peroxide-inducible genes activator n=1 Tax=Zavarzinia sp. CC-PAN008 TaxID=3243332 RepID=UPI003F7469EC
MVSPPSLRQLRYLIALEREAHFGRAASACHVSQSTLSAGIQELESALGAQLVERAGRRIALTPLGVEVAERARHVLAAVEGIMELARTAQEPLSGTLRLGVIPTVGPFLLPAALAALRAEHPRLRLFLHEDLTERLVAKLERGELDLLVLALPCACGDAATMDLMEDPFVFAARSDHPLATREAVATADLAGADLLLLADGHCLREHALAACDLGPRDAGGPYTATSLLTLVQMVANGLGVTLLPRMAVQAGILAGLDIVTRPILPPVAGRAAPSRRIGIAFRRGSSRRREFQALAQYLAPREGATPYIE